MEDKDDVSISKHSLADVEVARAVRAWLHVVASHVDFDECVAAAVETLSVGLPMASFGCSKCGATHLDTAKFAQKLHTRHVCQVCDHRWIKQPAVFGNPLAALGCSLEGAVLYVSRVPVTAGAPQVVSGQSSYVCGCGTTARGKGSCRVAACEPG